MSQRPSSRNSRTREKPMTRTKSSESNICERPQPNSGRVIEPIQEECADNNDSQINEDQCSYMDQEPRYDPKELRDAVRILNPFVRLIKDTNNPYARIVAREVCKTFYRLFHPNKHPLDVMKTINWRAKTVRTQQLWNEFWLYVPGSKIEEWVSLRELVKNDKLIDFSDYCSPCQTQTANSNSQVDDQQCHVNQVPNNENSVQQYSKPRRQNRCPQRSRRKSSEPVNFGDLCSSDAHQSLFDMSPPADISFEHQYAGSDNLPLAHNTESKEPSSISPSFQSTANQNKYAFNLDSKQCCEKISGTQNQVEQFDESTSKICHIDIEDAARKIKIKNCTCQGKRQPAGNDFNFPHSVPGCSSEPTYEPNLRIDTSQHEYYRITANTPSPQRNQNNTFQPLPKTPVEPELRTNALQCSVIENDEECSDSDSVNSIQSIQQIVCKSSLVANAFTNLSLAKKDLQTKTDAFNMLTQHYLNFVSNPIEEDPPCTNSPSAKMILQAIYKNPPKIIKPFNDCEWNDNAFHDKDFIRLLPFYESVHNQLEYISKTQRDYGINMLDDIMSTLYHIYYDLGDPRLKNDMLIEHVKLITRNTWETYFYKDKKMPAIPDKSLENYRPSLQNTPQQVSPPQPCPRQACPKPPNQRPPNVRQPVSSLPNPSGQSSGGQPCSSRAPKPNVCRRPRTTSNQRVVDDPQEAPAENKRTFLRRSRPSGAPKSWAPKLKNADRPDTMPVFKAKPLPKFVRDRLNNRDSAC